MIATGSAGEPEAPDVETSSAGYAGRFGGRSGVYLLAQQARAIERALIGVPPGTALDVGGAHAQLVDPLERLGWSVTVHGTADACERNLRTLHGKRGTPYVQGSLFALPAPDQSYDLVVAVRLVSHVGDWARLLGEMCRVARHAVVIDYPSRWALNALGPMLFPVKRSIERNTRSYRSFSRSEIADALGAHGFAVAREAKQFFLPMVVHRVAGGSRATQGAEWLFRGVGLTAVAGSPVILRADRNAPGDRPPPARENRQ